MGSSISSAMNANVQGLRGASRKFSAHAQSLASAGAVAGKEREAILLDANTSPSVQNFSASGVISTMKQYFTEVGAQKASKVATHMALIGQGHFVCNSSADDASPGRFGFTRVGNFEENKDGDFVNAAGQFLKVFYTDANGTILSNDVATTAGLKTASSRGLNGAPQPTDAISLPVTLPATKPVGPTATASTPVTVYDSLGTRHSVTFTWTKTSNSPQEWRVVVTTDDPSATIGAPYAGPGGMTIRFDALGNPALINGSAVAPTPALDITWSTPANPSTISLDLGTIGASDGIRAVGDSYDPGKIKPNGRPSGNYVSTSIDDQGRMFAIYDNNYRQQYAIIPLATFPNANELLEANGGVLYQTSESGDYDLTFANKGAAGGISVGSVEESTVDSAEVFTQILSTQQYYNGNLYAITKGEEMLDKLDRALA